MRYALLLLVLLAACARSDADFALSAVESSDTYLAGGHNATIISYDEGVYTIEFYSDRPGYGGEEADAPATLTRHIVRMTVEEREITSMIIDGLWDARERKLLIPEGGAGIAVYALTNLETPPPPFVNFFNGTFRVNLFISGQHCGKGNFTYSTDTGAYPATLVVELGERPSCASREGEVSAVTLVIPDQPLGTIRINDPALTMTIGGISCQFGSCPRGYTCTSDVQTCVLGDSVDPQASQKNTEYYLEDS